MMMLILTTATMNDGNKLKNDEIIKKKWNAFLSNPYTLHRHGSFFPHFLSIYFL